MFFLWSEAGKLQYPRLQNGRTTGDDPGCHGGNCEGTGVHITGTAIDIGTQHAEYQHLGYKHDKNINDVVND